VVVDVVGALSTANALAAPRTDCVMRGAAGGPGHAWFGADTGDAAAASGVAVEPACGVAAVTTPSRATSAW
jgi:hypothetical protein